MLKCSENSTTQEMSLTSSQDATVEMVLANKIFLTNVPPSMSGAIKNALSLPDPSYHQALKRNPNAKFYLSKDIKYYEESRDKSVLAIGRGNYDRVVRYAAQHGQRLRITDKRSSRRSRLRSTIELREYQLGVPEEIVRKDGGIVRLDTGWGKSIAALKVAEILNERTLIIVPKLDLVHQFRGEFEKYFVSGSLGRIQGSNFEIGDITIATIQSLRNRIKNRELKGDEFGCVIVDECHLTVPKKSRAIIQHFSPKYLYGFTATDRRTDGQGEALEFIFGEKIADKSILRASPKVDIYANLSHIWVDEYPKMIDEMVKDYDRNNLICDIIKKEAAEGGKILILTKRIKHYEILNELLGETIRGITLESKLGTKERNNLFSKLRSGTIKFDCIFGTFSLLSTGIDFPILDTLVIAGDLKSDVLTEQSAGRILRLLEGKDPKIIDIWDKRNYILKRQGKLRQDFYVSQDWPLTYYN